MKNNDNFLQTITILISLLIPFSTTLAGPPVKAQAIIKTCDDGEVIGNAELRERQSDQGVKLVRINMHLSGLPATEKGSHGVHIHETASCVPCGSAGGHFDPGPNSNTSPDGNHPFHSGDLVNIEVNKSGNGNLEIETTRVTLSDGPLSIFDDDGSAFIVHINEDTFCPEGNVGGCAGGGRLACGKIEIDSED